MTSGLSSPSCISNCSILSCELSSPTIRYEEFPDVTCTIKNTIILTMSITGINENNLRIVYCNNFFPPNEPTPYTSFLMSFPYQVIHLSKYSKIVDQPNYHNPLFYRFLYQTIFH